MTDDEKRLAIALRAIAEHERQEAAAKAKTIRELWDEWLPTLRGRYEANARSHARFVNSIGDLPWVELTRERFDQWAASVKASGVRGDRARPLSPGYCNRVRASLQGCLSWHLEKGAIDRNPLASIPWEDEEPFRRKGYMTEAQLLELMRYCKPILAHMLLTAFRCGAMRRDEVRLLRRWEVDLGAKKINLPKERTKTRRAREILVTNDVIEILRGYLATSPSDYVFASPSDPAGGPIPTSTLGDWMRAARKKWGQKLHGEWPTFHHARHSFSRNNHAKGVPVTWIKEQGGWRSDEIFEGYSTLTGEVETVAREMFNSTVSEARARQAGQSFPCYECAQPYATAKEAVACLDRHEAVREARRGPQATPLVPTPTLRKRRL